jgi:adenosylhomocysteine nucleosidase
VRLGLVVALPEEARALARVMSGVQRERKPGGSPLPAAVHLLAGTLAGQPVTVAWAGAGAGGAARAASAVLQRGAEGLLAVGFAGALSPALRPGDLLAATEVAEPDGGSWPADAGWLAALKSVPGKNDGCSMEAPSAIIPMTGQQRPTVAPAFHRGRLLTAPRVVAGAAEKRRLREETGALAVDMESAAVARSAATAGVPMMALRAITDGADESLPLDFELCFDSHGQFHPARLMGLLARRPFALGGLIRLGRHSLQAGRALASFLALALPCLARRK